MDRRTFIRGAAAGVGAAALSGGQAFARGPEPAVVGESPYGPLASVPDANGLLLPDGFSSRVIAVAGEPVGSTTHRWHVYPDGGGVVPTDDGGWIYVSNSEVFPSTAPAGGGVSAVRFSARGDIVDAYPLLAGSTSNCAGGMTPWGTWMSCEEDPTGRGLLWECDPMGVRPAIAREAMGLWRREAATVDPVRGHVYMTEDDPEGCLYRFTPDTSADLSAGILEVCVVSGDVVSWERIDDPSGASVPTRAQVSNATVFPGNEGIWFHDDGIYFCTKYDHSVHFIDVRDGKYRLLWAGDPDTLGVDDAVLSHVDNITVREDGHIFVAEDGGNMELVVMSPDGSLAPFLRIVNQEWSEITGPAFSPDGSRLYVSSQRAPTPSSINTMIDTAEDHQRCGVTYEITGPFNLAAAAIPSTSTTVVPTTVPPTTAPPAPNPVASTSPATTLAAASSNAATRGTARSWRVPIGVAIAGSLAAGALGLMARRRRAVGAPDEG